MVEEGEYIDFRKKIKGELLKKWKFIKNDLGFKANPKLFEFLVNEKYQYLTVISKGGKHDRDEKAKKE